MKIVPDTSAVIDGRITQMIRTGEYKDAIIIIPEAVVSEARGTGEPGEGDWFLGPHRLQDLSRMAKEGSIQTHVRGRTPDP